MSITNRSATKMNYCKSCLGTYTVNNQCDKCFDISEPVTIYNCDDPCPICLEYSDIKCVYDICHHWVCNKCHLITKQCCCLCALDNTTTLQDNITIVKYHKLNNYFDTTDPKIKNCFKKLYAQIDDSVGVGKNMFYELCVEYHKWLILLHLNDNNNNDIKLKPSDCIEKIWKVHLLDLESYLMVCNDVCHYVLYHYAENDYVKDFSKTKQLYESRFGSMKSIIWDFIEVEIMTEKNKNITISIGSNMTVKELKEYIVKTGSVGINSDMMTLRWKGFCLENYRTISDHKIPANAVISLFDDSPPKYDSEKTIIIFVRLLDGVTATFEISPDDTIYKLKEKIQKKNGIDPNLMRLMWAGKQLWNDRTIRDYGMKPYATAHLIMRLRGD